MLRNAMILAAKRTPILKHLPRGIGFDYMLEATLQGTLNKTPFALDKAESIILGCGLSLKEASSKLPARDSRVS